MALIEDMLEGGIGRGLVLGVGVAAVASLLRPVVGGVLRPVAKTAVKAGLTLYDYGQGAAARMTEMAGDLVAEARSEMQAGSSSSGTATAPQATEAHGERHGESGRTGGKRREPT